MSNGEEAGLEKPSLEPQKSLGEEGPQRGPDLGPVDREDEEEDEEEEEQADPKKPTTDEVRPTGRNEKKPACIHFPSVLPSTYCVPAIPLGAGSGHRQTFPTLLEFRAGSADLWSGQEGS